LGKKTVCFHGKEAHTLHDFWASSMTPTQVEASQSSQTSGSQGPNIALVGVGIFITQARGDHFWRQISQGAHASF